ncbi:MAG: glycosyltransferase family 1 protein [Niabella sp.]|nr:MAG: glycosyltransferase family 1 protein [Niabella sp.]
MRILILNWRSLFDPFTGGAETATFEHAKRWVKNHDAQVTWLSPIYNKKIRSENSEGINFKYLGFVPHSPNFFVRSLRFFIFYIYVFFYCIKSRNDFDIVIDQVHGLPYLTPLYIQNKIVVYIHEVAGDIWNKMIPFPLNIIGKFLESSSLKFYKNRPIVTVSESTKNDLIRIGIPEANIHVVNNGINAPQFQNLNSTKKGNFTILFLNRVVKMKGPERAIKILALLKKYIPDAHLDIIGKYEPAYHAELQSYASSLNVLNDIKFYGFVDEDEKFRIIRQSNVLINTSYKEGWGLVNIEANSQGVPVVAFNVEGNVDSVKNGVNGYLSDSEDAFAKNIYKLSQENLSASCIEYAQQFNWEKKSEEFWNLLQNV